MTIARAPGVPSRSDPNLWKRFADRASQWLGEPEKPITGRLGAPSLLRVEPEFGGLWGFGDGERPLTWGFLV